MIKYPNETPRKNKIETEPTAPLEYFLSFCCNPGLMKRQNSHTTYGKATTNPIINDDMMCIVNCPVMFRLCILKGMSFTHRSFDPTKSPSLQSHLKVAKSTRAGANMIFSKIHGAVTKAAIVKTAIAAIARTTCHLNS